MISPPELAQGLFSKARTHDVAIRFAQGPGENLSDRVSTHRGMAMKIFDVPGAKLPNHKDDAEVDFVFASGPTFPSGTAQGFLRDEKMLETATPMPEAIKGAVSDVARATDSALKAYSQAPVRFGSYVAKLAAFPAESPQLQKVKDVRIDTGSDQNAFRTAMDTQPIEDTSVEWPESESPYRLVVTVRILKQQVYSAERQRYFDDVISFRPGRCLEVHRPLGSVMRARLQVYPALSEFRHRENHIALEEPKDVSQIPA
ncbi:hypothetical protein MMC24_004245 [Lignoscripta atroalba]|nr:hypothetical protein [Lignoscripta atroalba]